MKQFFNEAGERIRQLNGRLLGDAGCKPALTTGNYVVDYGAPPESPNLQIKESWSPRKALRSWVANPRGLKLLSLMIGICQVLALSAGTLIYSGSTPDNDEYISSFDDICLYFDLSSVIADYGEGDWGICVSAFYDESMPEKEMSAALYLGSDITAQPLMRVGEIIKPPSPLFKVGNEFHISFPDIEVIPGQVYTLKVTYDFYAGLNGATNWTKATKLSFSSNPLIITFIGANDVSKILKFEQADLVDYNEIEKLNKTTISFNYQVDILDNFQAQIVEGNEVICSAESFSVDASDSKSIVINFPENTLYKGHNYSVEIPEGFISVAGEADVVNSAISIPFKGAAYRELTTGRIRPSNGSTTMMDEIVVPFNFPNGYGFVYVSDDTKYPIQIYKGNGTDGELVETLNATLGDDSKSLIFNPTFDIEPSTEYTLYMPEGSVKAYEIGAMKPTYLEDYISKAVELHYTTIALDELPALTITDCDYQDNEAVEYLGNVDWAGCTYTYAENVYNTGMTDYKAKGMLYKVNDGERELVKEVSLTKLRNEEDRLVIRAIVDSYLDKDMNYEVVIPEGTFTVTGSNFLKRYVRNEEAVLTLVGTYRTDFNVTIHSNAGHTTKTTVARGQDVTYEFSAPEGRTIEKVTLNGETIELNDGSYTINAISDDAVFVVTLNEVEPTVIVKEPEHVNVYLEVGDHVAVAHKVAKAQDAVVNVAPTQNWILSKLTLNDADVTNDVAENGDYIIPAASLANDANLKAEFAYNGTPMFDFTTGVNTVEGCDYRVYSDNSDLVIENVPANAHVAVYSVGGLLITEENNHGDTDMIRISLNPGVYVVIINNDALKVRHQ